MTMKEKQLDIIEHRYLNRRQANKIGWADADSYDRKSQSFDRLIAAYAIPETARVLELGCGAGNTTVYMAEAGFEAYGIDISPEAIEWARENAALRSVQAQFSVNSVTDLPFPDDFFNLVFDGDCLWMVFEADRRACFSSIIRKLKPDGILYALAHVVKEGVCTSYDITPDVHFDSVRLVSTIRNVPMYQFSRESEFLKEIEEAGFEIVRSSQLELSPLDSSSKNEMPFIAGTIFVEARKPMHK